MTPVTTSRFPVATSPSVAANLASLPGITPCHAAQHSSLRPRWAQTQIFRIATSRLSHLQQFSAPEIHFRSRSASPPPDLCACAILLPHTLSLCVLLSRWRWTHTRAVDPGKVEENVLPRNKVALYEQSASPPMATHALHSGVPMACASHPCPRDRSYECQL